MTPTPSSEAARLVEAALAHRFERVPRSGERRAALDALKAERSSQSKAASPGILVRAKAWVEARLEQAVERLGGGKIAVDKARSAEKTENREAVVVATRKAAAPVLRPNAGADGTWA